LKIVATELYDERDDPAETRNLASDPQFKSVIDRLPSHLPPPGSPSPKAAKATKAAKSGRKAQPATL
jgi:hypothetical protein